MSPRATAASSLTSSFSDRSALRSRGTADANRELSVGSIFNADQTATVAINSSSDAVSSRNFSRAGLAAGPMRPNA